MLLTILWLNLPLLQAYSPFNKEALEVIYGNYSIEDLFLPLDNETSSEDTDGPDEPPTTVHTMIDDEHLQTLEDVTFNATERDYDLIDFNEISREVANLTSRRKNSWSYFYGHDDPDDWYFYQERIEPKKKMMLIRINIQFLIHTRHKVYRALGERRRYRGDKRYRLGYLFNRMRRLNTEMRKVVSIASLQNSTNWYRSLTSLMRLYEQVVRFDVDSRDTGNFIKQVNAEEAAFDYYTLNNGKKPKA